MNAMAKVSGEPNMDAVDVVAVSALAQGHIIPLMRLCDLLSSTNLNVIFVTTPLNAERLRRQQADGSRVGVMEIPLPSFPGLPEGMENTERLSPPLVPLLYRAMEETQPSVREILVRFRPNSIIADVWPFYLPDLAAELKIPIIFFPTTGAYSQSLMYSLFNTLPLLHANGINPPPVVNLPGLPKAISLRDCDLLPPCREAVKSNPDSVKPVFSNGLRHFRECSVVIINTFYEMEAEMVDHLGTTFGKPVWSIGPLLHKKIACSGISAGNLNSGFSDSECLKWLDSQEPESVIYINFGSQIALSVHQMQEVAAGLKASGQSFLWAVKKQNEPEDMDEASFISSLPLDLQDFIERHSNTGDKSKCGGLVVVGWVPQSRILGHPAVGGHLSHCGWNSTMESIGQGVPMLAWPFQYDQPFVAKLLVEELGVAEEIQREENENGVFVVKREEVERAAKLIIRGEKGREMRRRALQLKESGQRAIQPGGFSFNNLECLVSLIRSKSI